MGIAIVWHTCCFTFGNQLYNRDKFPKRGNQMLNATIALFILVTVNVHRVLPHVPCLPRSALSHPACRYLVELVLRPHSVCLKKLLK